MSLGFLDIFFVPYFEYCLFFRRDFPVFFCIYIGGDLCVFYLLHLSLVCLCLACEFLEVSLAGQVIFSSVWGSAVWSVGPVQFI